MPVLLRAGTIVASSHFCQQLSVGNNSKTDQQSNLTSTSMAMACCHKEYAEECEILVCVDAPALHNPGLYQRLRFGLLSSSWLPSPLGIFLWSALHVMLLIVSGPAFWVLGLLTAFLYSVVMFGLYWIVYFHVFVVFGLFSVAVDVVLLLVQLIRFCWSLLGFLACHEPIAEWRGGERWTVLYWKDFGFGIRDIFGSVLPIGVPCMYYITDEPR